MNSKSFKKYISYQTFLALGLVIICSSIKGQINKYAKGYYNNRVDCLELEGVKSQTSREAIHIYCIGMDYYEKGQYDQAIKSFTKSLEIDPKYFLAYLNRGDVYYEKGQYDLAITDLTKALEIDQKNFAAYHNRGVAYYAKGQYGLAIKDLTKALEIDPKNANAFYHRGIAYENKGQYDLAIKDYTKVLEIDPKYTEASNSLENIKKKKK